MEKEIKITVRNLSKSYGGTPVLENVSFTADNSRPLCIMAPSGAGKTTLVSIIMGLEKADSGSISGTEGKRFSAVFQEDRLCEDLSAFMNVAVADEKADSDGVRRLLLDCGLLPEDIYRPVRELSGGQRRRAAIVRALLSDSDILVFDEPFKGLDEDTLKTVVQMVQENINGRLLLVITHDAGLSRRLGADVFSL